MYTTLIAASCALIRSLASSGFLHTSAVALSSTARNPHHSSLPGRSTLNEPRIWIASPFTRPEKTYIRQSLEKMEYEGAPATHKKKRAYAAQAYDFGANAAAAAPLQPAMMGAGGMPQPGMPQVGMPQVGMSQAGVPKMGYPQTSYPQAGYPQPGYPQVGMPQDQLAGQFGQMNIQEKQQLPPQMQPHLNQLYPSDLISQPFNVLELDLPPPPINLPPNVRRSPK